MDRGPNGSEGEAQFKAQQPATPVMLSSIGHTWDFPYGTIILDD